MTIALYIVGVAIFILLLAISVGLHEAGHMIAARKLGVKVPRFFIGFGKTLWSKKIAEAEYGVKAIPLGGFVEIVDDSVPEGRKERELLSYVAPWRRYIIYAAGPLVNIFLGFIILFGLFATTPTYTPGTTISGVQSCDTGNCHALEAGVQAGDKIIEVNGGKINEFADLDKYLTQDNTITVLRDGQEVVLQVEGNEENKIGVLMGAEKKERTLVEAVQEIGNLLVMNIEAIGRIPEHVPNLVKTVAGTEERASDTIGSVITVGNVYGNVASSDSGVKDKFVQLLGYAGMFNLGLGLINLLPILPLDGGRMLITFFDQVKWWIARVRRKDYAPFNLQLVESMMWVTGAIVFGFMALLLLTDVVAPIQM